MEMCFSILELYRENKFYQNIIIIIIQIIRNDLFIIGTHDIVTIIYTIFFG